MLYYICIVRALFLLAGEKTFSENKTARGHVSIIKLSYTPTAAARNPIKKMICRGNLFQALGIEHTALVYYYYNNIIVIFSRNSSGRSFLFFFQKKNVFYFYF